MKQSRLARITLILLIICLVIGIGFVISLPWTLPFILLLPDLKPQVTPNYYIALSLWMAGGIGGLSILCTLIRMLRTLSQDPFVQQNVNRLKYMGVTALGMALLTVLACLLYFRPLLIALGCALGMCGLFSLVLCGVFRQAVAYREENALTI